MAKEKLYKNVPGLKYNERGFATMPREQGYNTVTWGAYLQDAKSYYDYKHGLDLVMNHYRFFNYFDSDKKFQNNDNNEDGFNGDIPKGIIFTNILSVNLKIYLKLYEFEEIFRYISILYIFQAVALSTCLIFLLKLLILNTFFII